MMIRITDGPTERIVSREDLRKWEALGYKTVAPLPDLSEAATEPDPEPALEPDTEAGPEKNAKIQIPEDLASMNLKDLRVLAKKIGIQGFQNMDKITLIAVIQAH